MTREEWIDEMDSLSALIDWCRENAECEDTFDDFIYEDSLDEYVAEDIRNFDYGWDDLRDNLNNIQTGYPWYRVDGSFDYVGFDEDDYDEFKETVLECLDEEGYFEDDDDEEPDPPVWHEEHAQQEIEIEVPDEPEIDAVDLGSFDDMSTVIWGITQDYIEPMPDPNTVMPVENNSACYATVQWRDIAEPDEPITPVDLEAIPFGA